MVKSSAGEFNHQFICHKVVGDDKLTLLELSHNSEQFVCASKNLFYEIITCGGKHSSNWESSGFFNSLG